MLPLISNCGLVRDRPFARSPRHEFCVLLASMMVIGGGGARALADAPVVKLLPHAESVEKFDPIELVIDVAQPPFANPFIEAQVRAEFRCGAQRVEVEGFCDDEQGRRFHVRFMPSEVGSHQFRVWLKSDLLNWDSAGVFQVTAGDNAGPVIVDPDFPFHFLRQGRGEHWFWNGTTTYQLLAWDETTISESLTRLASLGVNRIRVALAARTADGDRWMEPLVKRTSQFAFQVAPWPAARPESVDNPGYDTTRFDLAMFRKADRMLTEARRRDIQVSLIFYLDGADAGVVPFNQRAAGGPDEQRYYNYVLARFGAYDNVMWDLTNEWHLFRDEKWVKQMGTHVDQHDPFRRLTSVHGDGRFLFRTEKWADLALYQSWDEHGGYGFMLANRKQQLATGRPMPQVNEEYGYEDHYPYPWGEKRVWPARSADNRRRLAWEMSMAGCYQTTGERANDGVGAGADSGGGWINGRGNDSMTMLVGYRRMKEFFTSFPWWELEPAPQLAGSGSLVLAKQGELYAVYTPQGGPASVTLPAGRYNWRWYSPRVGKWEARSEFELAASQAWKSADPSDAGDWAILIERQKPRTN